MEKQAHQLQGQVREEEDRVLEMMDQAEALQSQTAARTADVDRIERDWKQSSGPAFRPSRRSSRPLRSRTAGSGTTSWPSIDPAHLQTLREAAPDEAGQRRGQDRAGEMPGLPDNRTGQRADTGQGRRTLVQLRQLRAACCAFHEED